jgi:3-deoxy-D-manno-octulosonic-acid transferase
VYTLADVVFVGRSLADMGGSDTMEVAGLGKPMFVGPHNENFADIAERLLTARAMRRIELDLRGPGVAAAVADTVAGMLNDRSGARAMGEAARRVVLETRGAWPCPGRLREHPTGANRQQPMMTAGRISCQAPSYASSSSNAYAVSW